MIKKIVFTSAAVVGLSCLVFGATGTWNRVTVALSGARHVVDENTDSRQLLALARKQKAGVEINLQKAEAVVVNYQRDAERTATEIKKITGLEDVGRQRLAILGENLRQNAGSFVRAGCQYSRREVEADAASLVASIQEWAATIELKNSSLKTLKQAISRAEKTVTQGQEGLRKLEGQIKKLEIGIVTEEARKEVTDAIAVMEGAVSAEVDGDLAKTLSTLENRHAAMKKVNDAATGDLPGNIVWEADQTTPQTLMEQINATLSPAKPVAAPVPAATTIPVPAAAMPMATAANP